MSEKLQKLLKKLLGDDLYKSISQKLDGEKAFKIDVIQEGEQSLFVPMARFKEVNEKQKEGQTLIDEAQKKSAKEITDLTTKLETLAKSGGDADQLKTQITELQTQVKDAGDLALKDIVKGKVKAHVREVLLTEGANASYLDFLETKVNFEKIATSDDGNTHTGASDQIPEMKKTLAAMFVNGKTKVHGTGHEGGSGDDPPEGIFSEEHIKKMGHKEIKAEQEKVDKSLVYHAEHKS